MYHVDYESLIRQLIALTDGVPYVTANLANASALLWQFLPQINWAGFYLMEDGALVLGPFQGKPACIRIRPGQGVCGTAVAEDRVQLVMDVHKFAGHIACDPDSNAEIVIPIHRNGKIWGVLDIDSPEVGRFRPADQQGLVRFAEVLEDMLRITANLPRNFL